VNDVKNDGPGQNEAGDPMPRYPWKPDSDNRKKRGSQQREHGGSHNPMK
jgi:hypothetical protein